MNQLNTPWHKTTGIKAARVGDTTSMSHEEWLETRRTGIGGSDIGAIVGLSPYSSPLDVYLHKTGQLEPIRQTEAMYWGVELEPVIAAEFNKRHPEFKIQRVNAVLQSVDHPVCLADIDRLIQVPSKPNGVLEAKCTSAYGAEMWEDNEIPDSYMCQAQWYLGVTGLQYGYFAVLVGGNHYEERYIERSDSVVQSLFTSAEEFWEKNVCAGVPPDPALGASKVDNKLLQKLYPISADKIVDLPTEAKFYVEARESSKQTIAEAEGIQADAENKLKALLGDAEIGTISGYRVSWKTTKARTNFDTGRFKQEHPDMFKEFASDGAPSRRFTIKPIK